jgi:hypothetical protein
MKRQSSMELALVALLICMAAAPSLAHHSHVTFYDACKPVTLEGRIESIQWKDPHILFDLELDDGRTYRAEWLSLHEVTTRGGTDPAQRAQAVLTFGTRVVVMGNPLRDDPQTRASFPGWGPNVVDVMQMRRADNSWSWRAASPPPCTAK